MRTTASSRLTLAPQQFNNYPPNALMKGHQDLTSLRTKKREDCLLYVHVPFCRQKCGYCVLSSLIRDEAQFEKILADLEREAEVVASQFGPRTITAALYGGGTPSNLSVQQILSFYSQIYKLLKFDSRAEITVEVRPGTFTLEKLKAFTECGVNRLSFGVQTLIPRELRYCGRQNTYEIVASNLELAHKAGFKNVNFDIIYGLPEQTPTSFEETCQLIFAKLQPQHVCLYLLIVHSDTAFAKLKKAKPELFPNEAAKQQMFDIYLQTARKNSYVNTSVENVARSSDLYSRYQRLNWRGLERIALGPEAIGFANQCQYVHLRYGKKYQEAIKHNQLPIDFAYELNQDELLRRRIILGLHNLKLNLKEISQELGVEATDRFQGEWQYLENNGFLVREKGKAVLTDKGIKFFYHVQSQFFDQKVKKVEDELKLKAYKEKAE